VSSCSSLSSRLMHVQTASLRAMITELLASRTKIYASPSLNGVNENFGNRINQKMQQVMKKLCAACKVEGIVDEEVQRMTRRGSGGGAGEKGQKTKRCKVKEEPSEQAKAEQEDY